MRITPYWHDASGAWVFDDPLHCLVQEPFVLGVSHMIDLFAENIPNARKGFVLCFSERRFAGSDKHITRLFADMGGWWYQDEHGNNGWLCPAMFHYFGSPPHKIYIKAEPIV